MSTATDELRDLMEQVTRRVLHEIKPTMDFLKANDVGVTIFAFALNPIAGPPAPGAIAYISTANRKDMIDSVKEWIAFQEAGLATEPRGDRGQS